MKFAMKTLAAAAAIVSSGLAMAAPQTGAVGEHVLVTDPGGSGRQAELTLVSGFGGLTFSSSFPRDANADSMGGLVGALNTGGIVVSTIGADTTLSETFAPDSTDAPVRVGVNIGAAVSSLTADNVTGQVLSVQSVGGARQLGTRIAGTLNGGYIDVTNLRFDLANMAVYADLVGQAAKVGTKPAVDYSSLNTKLWTIGAISGPTVIPPAALLAADPVAAMQAAGFGYLGQTIDTDGRILYKASATNRISGLKVTQSGFDLFSKALGLGSVGIGALNNVNLDPDGWGYVDSKIIFTAKEVPEPSTYAMTLTGLVLVGAVAARRRRRAA